MLSYPPLLLKFFSVDAQVIDGIYERNDSLSALKRDFRNIKAGDRFKAAARKRTTFLAVPSCHGMAIP